MYLDQFNRYYFFSNLTFNGIVEKVQLHAIRRVLIFHNKHYLSLKKHLILICKRYRGKNWSEVHEKRSREKSY